MRSYRFRAPLCTRLSSYNQQPHSQSQSPMLQTHRQFSQFIYLAYPRKDSQDKDSMNTEATEYSKSATDDEGARQENAAFNLNITDPQEQKNVAGEGTGKGTVSKSDDTNNPLEVSPANPELSKQRGQMEGGPENSSASSNTTSDRQRSSGGGGSPKGSKVA
ncbi:hypothetical protein N7G274_002547 [Stereocaulon virgatum]|uniref:Mucin-associated surface protein (MASP) n=1 Tax=Stereocaulon virgatum TaxID=373712 RepID=A0ABR4AG36_9LECA